MVDMCLCTGVDCPMSSSCFRYLVEPNPYRQSMFVGLPNNEDGSCGYYINIEDYGRGYKLKEFKNEDNIER